MTETPLRKSRKRNRKKETATFAKTSISQLPPKVDAESAVGVRERKSRERRERINRRNLMMTLCLYILVFLSAIVFAVFYDQLVVTREPEKVVIR